jgi:5-(carboxyamino)imidazole ribonucleotide synthase
MLALAGIPMGIQFAFLDPDPAAPAAGLGHFIRGDFHDPEALRALASNSQVITYEFENIPVGPLAELRQDALWPPLDALATAQDRVNEKALFKKLDIPSAAYQTIDDGDDLLSAAQAIGLPAVLKARRLGYDGRGQVFVDSLESLSGAWEQLGRVPAILEQRICFERELSLVAVAGQGDIKFYPLTENVHQQGILHTSLAPAPDPRWESEAQGWLRAMINHFGYRGVLTVEFFATSEGLLANETAPRVHNSGHWTIEGAATSQFENHLRGVLGWPLGDTACRGGAAMLNLIGTLPEPTDLLSVPGAHFHSYGKHPRPGRKLGHYTIVAADPASARRGIQTVIGGLETTTPT